MSGKRTYTDAEKAAYWRSKATGGNSGSKSYSKSSYNKSDKKRSGAKYGFDKAGRRYISAWKVSKRSGMISLMVFEMTGKGELQGTKNGRTYRKFGGEMVFKDSGQIHKVYGLVYDDSQKFFVEKFGLVASPKAPRGGYFGKVGK